MIHECLKLKLSYIFYYLKKKKKSSNSSANKVNTNHKIKLLAYVTNFINNLMNISLEDWLKNINIMLINYFATNTITCFTISSKKKKKKKKYFTCWDKKLWMVNDHFHLKLLLIPYIYIYIYHHSKPTPSRSCRKGVIRLTVFRILYVKYSKSCDIHK